MNIMFHSESGRKLNIAANHGTTMEQLIKIFLYRVGNIKLIDSYYSLKDNSGFYFEYSHNYIKFGEQRYVENFFSQISCNIYTNI